MSSLHLENYFDTSNMTNVRYMFQHTGYGKMTSLTLGNKFNKGKVIDMLEMFYETGHHLMNALDLGDFEVEHLDSMNLSKVFVDCENSETLTYITVKNETLKEWFDSRSTANIPVYIKNIIKVES